MANNRSHIQALDFTGLDLNSADCSWLGHKFAAAQYLEQVTFTNNCVNNSNSASICRGVSQNRCTSTLDLRSNNLSDGDPITSLIRSGCGVRNLYLSSNSFGSDVPSIIRALGSSNISHIDLSSSCSSYSSGGISVSSAIRSAGFRGEINLKNHGWESNLEFANHITATERQTSCTIGINWDRVRRTIQEEEERLERERRRLEQEAWDRANGY